MPQILLIGSLLLPLTVFAGSASPIPTDNTLPVMRGAGVSLTRGVNRLSEGKARIQITGLLQSHANVAESGDESLTIDGEMHAMSIILDYGWSSRLTLEATAGVNRVTAGGLDQLIDDWHEAFSLPDGDRARLPPDRLRIAYTDGTDEQLIERSKSGFTDLQLGLAYRWLSRRSVNSTVRASVNLPTGDPDRLSGSDDADLSIGVYTEGNSIYGAQAWGWHGSLGLLLIGDDTLFGIETKSSAIFGSAGLHWQAGPRWRWSAQLDMHSALFDSGIEELNRSAWQLALAGEYQWNKRMHTRLFFTEDLSVNRSADFGLGASIVLNY